MKISSHIVKILFLIILFTSSCSPNRLYSPKPFAITKSTNQDKVKLAILEVLNKRKWKVKKELLEFIEAKRRDKQYNATIRIHFDRRQVRIRYFDSENLNYIFEDKVRKIHPKYNKWIKVLEKDLLRTLKDV